MTVADYSQMGTLTPSQATDARALLEVIAQVEQRVSFHRRE